MLDLATDEDVPLLDLRVPLVDFATMQANGYVADHVHFTNTGHAIVGAAFDQALDAMSVGATVPAPSPSNAYRLFGRELVVAAVYGLVGGELVAPSLNRT